MRKVYKDEIENDKSIPDATRDTGRRYSAFHRPHHISTSLSNSFCREVGVIMTALPQSRPVITSTYISEIIRIKLYIIKIISKNVSRSSS